MNIKKAEQMIDQVAGVVSNWKTYAKTVGVDKDLKEAIGKTLLKI